MRKAGRCVFFSEIGVSPAPAPRLQFLMNVVDTHLPEVIMTSDPRSVLQYVISVLLQLNIESATAQLDQTIDSREHQRNRTLLRHNLLLVLNGSVHLTSLSSVQQMAFALHLLTVSTVCTLSTVVNVGIAWSLDQLLAIAICMTEANNNFVKTKVREVTSKQ